MSRRKPDPPKAPPFPARPCGTCGGLVLIGMESFHMCPGPRRGVITIADGTRGMQRGS